MTGDRIISHRLRGFAKGESGREGIVEALKAGIAAFETDIRFTADGIAVLHHDADLRKIPPPGGRIARLTLEQLQSLQSENGHAPLLTLDEMLAMLERSGKQCPEVYLDIKETGFEEELSGRIRHSEMGSRMTVISWLPEVLRAWHRYSPETRLCFSVHLCLNAAKRQAIRASLAIHGRLKKNAAPIVVVNDYYNSDSAPADSRGMDFEHILSEPPRGELGVLLRNTNGIVCTHYSLLTRKLLTLCREAGIKVMVYSINTERLMKKFTETLPADYILSDNPAFCGAEAE